MHKQVKPNHCANQTCKKRNHVHAPGTSPAPRPARPSGHASQRAGWGEEAAKGHRVSQQHPHPGCPNGTRPGPERSRETRDLLGTAGQRTPVSLEEGDHGASGDGEGSPFRHICQSALDTWRVSQGPGTGARALPKPARGGVGGGAGPGYALGSVHSVGCPGPTGQGRKRLQQEGRISKCLLGRLGSKHSGSRVRQGEGSGSCGPSGGELPCPAQPLLPLQLRGRVCGLVAAAYPHLGGRWAVPLPNATRPASGGSEDPSRGSLWDMVIDLGTCREGSRG